MRDPLKRTLLILTFVTGIVDVVSFLALGSVFSAMQTGNVIFLGLGIAGIQGAPVLAPLVALGAILLGAVSGALLLKTSLALAIAVAAAVVVVADLSRERPRQRSVAGEGLEADL